MNVNQRQRFLGLATLAAVVVWAGDRLVLGPLVNGWKARADRIVNLQKSVAQGAVLLERETTIRDRWNHIQTNSLTNAVSAAENQVLKAFDRWSRESGVSISSIRPQWKGAEGDYATLECRADASGNLGTLTRFLYEVEKDPLGIKIDSLELSTRDNDGQQITLGLQVSGLVLKPSGT